MPIWAVSDTSNAGPRAGPGVMVFQVGGGFGGLLGAGSGRTYTGFSGGVSTGAIGACAYAGTCAMPLIVCYSLHVRHKM